MRVAALFALAASLLASSAGVAPATGTWEFEFSRLNRVYRDVAGALEPAEAGPFRIELSTPRQEVTLRRHRVRLSPRGGGTHDAEVRAEFRGQGRLDARASVLGLGQGFQDDVTLPDQALAFRARVRIARAREGYLVTALALPAEAEVLIRSRLGTSLVRWCERLAVLPCDGLGAALRTAVVPLPPPGRAYLLADTDLSAEDRRRLDEYLGGRKRP